MDFVNHEEGKPIIYGMPLRRANNPVWEAKAERNSEQDNYGTDFTANVATSFEEATNLQAHLIEELQERSSFPVLKQGSIKQQSTGGTRKFLLNCRRPLNRNGINAKITAYPSV